MKFASSSALLLIAASQVLGTASAFARGHGNSNNSNNNHSGSFKQVQQMQTTPKFSGKIMQGGNSQPTFKGNFPPSRQHPIYDNINKVKVNSNVKIGPNTPILVTPSKPIDPGKGNGKPIIHHPIGIDVGQGKGLDSPVDLGIGKKTTIKPPFVFDVGQGKGKIPFNPDLVGKFKDKINPIDPGIGNGKPKIPICPPYPYPKHPLVGCAPCPSFFGGWCWYPGFGNCYGYTGGVCLPTVVTETVVLELPAGDALPQVVPGTTVTAMVDDNGADAGRVLMQYGSLAMPVEVVRWEAGQVTFVIPSVAVKDPTAVRFVFLRANGELAQMLDCELVAVTLQQ